MHGSDCGLGIEDLVGIWDMGLGLGVGARCMLRHN